LYVVVIYLFKTLPAKPALNTAYLIGWMTCLLSKQKCQKLGCI
jgi:hypothetical protein